MAVLSPAASWRMMMISSPASRVRPPASDRTERTVCDRDAPAQVFQDVDGHLGLDDDLLAGELGQLLLHLELGKVPDLDLPQHGQGDPAFFGDADDELVDLLDAEDRDLEEVLGADLVFGAHRLLRGRRQGQDHGQGEGGEPGDL
jgi:hypothetical protein